MAGKLGLKKLRFGRINYVNTVPFYHELFNPDEPVQVIEGSPTELNAMMHAGALDFAPISSLEYALHQDQYYLFPDLCIGARDFSRSVILFSRERIEGLNHETIVLSKKSLSSRALLKILLKRKYGFRNQFVSGSGTPDEMLRQAKAALAIGDEALFYQPQEFVYKSDLGELWWDWTKLPFCFSVWAVRRALYDEAPREVFAFHRQLSETVERNLEDLETLIRNALNITLADERFSSVFGYLFNLNYRMDSEMLEGLKLFYEYAAELRLAPPTAEIRFLELPS